METSKPDLMSASPRATEGKRILAQLEHGPRTPAGVGRAAGRTIDGWTISLGVLLLLMGGVAWLLHDQRITPATFRADSGYTAARSAPSPSRHVARAGQDQPGEQAAAIVNEAAAPATAPATAGSNDAHAGPTAGGARVAVAAPTPTAVTAAIANTAAPTSSRAGVHKPAPPRVATVKPAPAASDSDVTLLTALVAHADQPDTVAPERSRDVVERQDGDSTAHLLARCKQLGLIEGMLCRSRICAGRWEAEAACRAPAHGSH